MDRSIRYLCLFYAIILFLSGVLSHPVNSQPELEVVNNENGSALDREERQRWRGGGGGGGGRGGGGYYGGGGHHHGGQGGQGGYRRYGNGK
ncbi:unnamed protein product [Allacma fusca]|uniref:Glycine-rich protein n=1 Tax=Allacma fusca TaxID=39272 RepID=A0A8J2L7A9_9HEXA|nr:unnamed protein product [Allacma fusca]